MRIYAYHDATTGFHDIKPLPAFHPLPWETLLTLLAALLIAAALAVLYRRRRRRQPVAAIVSPLESALGTFDRIQRSSADVRTLATEVSFAVRRFLEDELRFPATDETVQEVASRLPAALISRSGGKRERIEHLSTGVLETLNFAAYLAFAEDSSTRYQSQHQEVVDLLDRARKVVKEIAALQAESVASPKQTVEA